MTNLLVNLIVKLLFFYITINFKKFNLKSLEKFRFTEFYIPGSLPGSLAENKKYIFTFSSIMTRVLKPYNCELENEFNQN